MRTVTVNGNIDALRVRTEILMKHLTSMNDTITMQQQQIIETREFLRVFDESVCKQRETILGQNIVIGGQKEMITSLNDIIAKQQEQIHDMDVKIHDMDVKTHALLGRVTAMELFRGYV